MIGGGKIFPVASQLRRGLSVNGASNKDSSDDSLDLFSRTRRSVSVVNSDESDGSFLCSCICIISRVLVCTEFILASVRYHLPGF